MRYVTSRAQLTCCHGGKVVIPAGMTRWTIDGVEVVAREALIGAPVMGCPNGPAPGLVPCTAVVSVLDGTSPGAKLNGLTPLLEAATGLTNSVPPGRWKVEDAGQARVTESTAAAGVASSIEGHAAPEAGRPPVYTTRPGPRDLNWGQSHARLGETVQLVATCPNVAEGSATFDVFECLPDDQVRHIAGIPGAVARQKATAKWQVAYPALDPAADARRPADAFASMVFSVTHAGSTTPMALEKAMKVTGGLRAVATDDAGAPLADQRCIVCCASGTTHEVRSDANGVVRVATDLLHPASPGVFFPDWPAQAVARPHQVYRPDDGELAAAQACAILNETVRRCESWLASDGDAEPALRPVIDRAREASRQIDDDYKPQLAAAAALALPLSAGEATLAGGALAMPAAGSLMATGGTAAASTATGGTALTIGSGGIALIVVAAAGVMYWLLNRKWDKGASQQAVSRLGQAVNDIPARLEPAVPVPPLKVIDGGGGRQRKPEPEPPVRLAPFPLSPPAREQDRARRVIQMYWPIDYLPVPPGWFHGVIVSRSAMKSSGKRAGVNQRLVQEMIRETASFAGNPARKALLDVWRYRRLAFAQYLRMQRRRPDLVAVLNEVRVIDETLCAIRGGGAGADGLPARFHAHHVVPLYFQGGVDSVDNLSVIDARCHLIGHALLRYQDHWPAADRAPRDLTQHPITFNYRVHFRTGPADPTALGLRLLVGQLKDDPEETDYLDGADNP